VISVSLAEKARQMNGLNQVISFDSCRFNPGNLSDCHVRLGGVISSIEDGSDHSL
jgi:hypothetical protein